MGLHDVDPANALAIPKQRTMNATNRRAAYRHHGPEQVPSSNGSYGTMPSDRAHDWPSMPQQNWDSAAPMAAAENTPATHTRKRKAPGACVEGVAVVDLTGDSPPSEAPRDKRLSTASKRARTSINNDNANKYTATSGGRGSSSRCSSPTEKKSDSTRKHTGDRQTGTLKPGLDSQAVLDAAKKPLEKPKQDGEKRLRRYRARPPSAYREVRDRALTQRMFALDRQRSNDNPDHPSETVSLAGTTGNVYTITIDKVPSCDCPHARKGNQCKHIVYVLSRILRAPSDLEYQLAFLSEELKRIFENAPPLPSETAGEDAKDGNRKPVEGECPICCMDFEPESSESIVYCKAVCGNNIHKDCFAQWAATKNGQVVTCPFCREPWKGDETQLKEVAKNGTKNAEGYVNVASQLGISGRRDYSTYNSFWVRGRAQRGEVEWDVDGVMDMMDHDYPIRR